MTQIMALKAQSLKAKELARPNSTSKMGPSSMASCSTTNTLRAASISPMVTFILAPLLKMANLRLVNTNKLAVRK